MKKIYALYFLILALNCAAQTKLELAGKIKYSHAKILIRMAASSRAQYNAVMKNGITITRYEKENHIPVRPVLIAVSLKHYSEDDTIAWKNFVKTDTNRVGFVYNALFPDRGHKTQKNPDFLKYDKMIFDMLMLSCNFDKEIAQACGLYFADTTADVLKSYIYKVTTKRSDGITIELLNITADPNPEETSKTIKNLHGKSRARIATLRWNAKELLSHYNSFIVERSPDSIVFTRINKAPLILIKTANEINKESIYYTDTMTLTNHVYFYRIKGVDYFGEESLPSNIIRLNSHHELTAAPVIYSLNVSNNLHVALRWKLTDTLQNNRVRKYIIERSLTVNKNYSVIYAGIQTRFTDSLVKSSNYYRVGAITAYNDTVYSHSRLVVIYDTIAPDTPAGLKGYADKQGNVYLSWQRVSDKLKGYKIFKANSLSEEFVQLNNKFITDTSFRDKINLNTLSNKAYYCVAAVDDNFNNSPASAPIAVKRPDTIPPAKPVLFTVAVNEKGIALTVIPSLSEDVERHLVYRKSSSSQFELIGGFNSRDSIYIFTDTLLKEESNYEYKVSAIDDSWNTSESESVSYYAEVKLKKKIEDVLYEVNRKEKFIKLSWNYAYNNIDRFIVYRGSSNYPLTIVKTLPGEQLSFTDNTINIGNEYEYRIKAVFTNDVESLISDAIKIVY